MKCPRCDHVRAGQASFCSRCGAALKPAGSGRGGAETVLLTVRSSWWRFLADILFAIDFALAGLYLFVYGVSAIPGVLLVVAGLAIGGLVIFVGKRTTWTLTSERLIAHHAQFHKKFSEITLTDTRSINVMRSQPQKLLFGTGSVVVASLSNAALQMRIDHIPHPDEIAQAIKEARRKRFA